MLKCSEEFVSMFEKCSECCHLSNYKSRFPISSWIPAYKWSDASADLIAGITVGLTVIPQGIAYALIAGLPHEYGLYSSFLGSFIYIFLGNSKDITMGATSIMALMTGVHVRKHGLQYAILLSFTSGKIY